MSAARGSRTPAREQDGGRPVPRWWGPTAVAAALAGIAIVVVLWLKGGGAHFVGPIDTPLSLGRLTGLLASDLLLLQLLLMARIPWAERSFGQDRLAHAHRLVGFTSVWLMLAHVLLIEEGYAAAGRSGLLSETWTQVRTYPGMLMATVGTLLLVAVATLSVRAARRSLRYETWHLLHLYAYLGVGLALPHQIWTGADFTSSLPARVYWWTLYAVAAAAVVGFRIARPIRRTLTHDVRVREVIPESPGVVSVHLSGLDLDRLGARPGQFLVWRFRDGAGWTRGHPFTLSLPVTGDRLRITARAVGDGSARLRGLRDGTRVSFEGPFGAFTPDRVRGGRVLMMAAGIGITPMRAMLDELVGRGTDVVVVHRTHDGDDLPLRAELEEYAARGEIKVEYLVGPRPDRPHWAPAGWEAVSPAHAIRHVVPDVAEREVLVCGPGPWIVLVRTALAAAGVPRGAVHSEEFAW